MSRPVKPSRAYNISSRRAQARRNRAAVLEAARRLFLERGYAATTMAAVAAEAGLSVESVYKAFANKPGLAKAVFDVAIVGDDESVPLIEREHIARMRAEPDPRRVLHLYGEHLTTTMSRAGPVQLLIRSAAAGDAGAAGVWAAMQGERLKGMTMFAADLRSKGHLRADVTDDDARDVLWTYTSVELYELLVLDRRWAPERYGTWVADALVAALLR